MNRSLKAILIVVFLFTWQFVLCQTNRYMVHLSDKQNSIFTIDNPEAFLSERAIERRSRQNISISEQDFPVNQTYVEGLRGSGADVLQTSKWFNGVLIQCDASLISAISALPYVDDVEYVAPGAMVTTRTKTRDSDLENFDTRATRTSRKKQEASEFQNNLLGVDAMHESGVTGEGIMIAIMDGGFFGARDLAVFSHLYDNGKVIYTYDYVEGQSDVYRYSSHGTQVFSLLGAYEQDVFVGSAYDSDYMLFVTEDDCSICEYRIEEYNWAFAAEFADSAGVDVINTSLGYNWFEDPEMDYDQQDMDGNTSVITIASDIAFSKGIIVVAAAGNEARNDWGIITAPADGFKVIGAGNITSDGERAPSSSIGPTADNRIKPDLVTLGTGVQVISSSGNIISGNGTSFSSPQIAGLCALIIEAYPELSVEDIRFLLMETASNTASPNNEIGYGIPNFNAFNNYITFSDSEKSFMLYPNPVDNNRLVIRVNNPGETPSVNVQVFNTSGKKMLEQDIDFTWQNNSRVIDIFNLTAGIYIFNIKTGKSVEKLRIIKI